MQRPELPPLSSFARSTQAAVHSLHARWAAEEAAMRRSQPDFDLQNELRSPEMRRLMQLPGMRVRDAYRLAHYDENLRTAAQAVEQGVVERIQQRAARPTENGIRPGGAATVRPDVASMPAPSAKHWNAVCSTEHRSNCDYFTRERNMSMNKNFNIQLFAENLNTTATMSKEMKTFYEKRLIDQAEPRLVHDQFADYYPVPQNGGKTIEFRKYDSLPKASTPLTEGVTPNGQALNVTTITSDLHQYGGWTPLTDVLQMTAIDNNVVQATRVLASQAGRTMDSITRDVLAGGTNVIYAPKLAADGTETAVASRKALDKTCTLTPKLFFQAAAQLGAMNADPIGDSYIAIIHPYAAYDLKTSKEFIEVHKYADPDTMFRGEIGKLGNIRFIETSEAKIWKDSTCPDGLAVFGTLVLGAHAYGVTELEGGGLEHIVKQLGYGDDPLNQRASVGWKGMRAAERLVEQYMVRIESASSYSATAAAN